MEDKKKEPCRWCNGVGMWAEHGFDKNGNKTHVVVTCSRCKGHGTEK